MHTCGISGLNKKMSRSWVRRVLTFWTEQRRAPSSRQYNRWSSRRQTGSAKWSSWKSSAINKKKKKLTKYKNSLAMSRIWKNCQFRTKLPRCRKQNEKGQLTFSPFLARKIWVHHPLWAKKYSVSLTRILTCWVSVLMRTTTWWRVTCFARRLPKNWWKIPITWKTSASRNWWSSCSTRTNTSSRISAIDRWA